VLVERSLLSQLSLPAFAMGASSSASEAVAGAGTRTCSTSSLTAMSPSSASSFSASQPERAPASPVEDTSALEREELQRLLDRVIELEKERGALERRLQRAATLESTAQALSEENEGLRTSLTAAERREQALSSEASALRGQVQRLTKALQDLIRPMSRGGLKSRLDAERFASGRSVGSDVSSGGCSPARTLALGQPQTSPPTSPISSSLQQQEGAGEERERQDDRDIQIVSLIKERDVLRAKLKNSEVFDLVNDWKSAGKHGSDRDKVVEDCELLCAAAFRRDLERVKEENSSNMKKINSLQEEVGSLTRDKLKLLGELKQASSRIGGLDFLEKEHHMLSKISIMSETNTNRLLTPSQPTVRPRWNLRETVSEGAPAAAAARLASHH